MGIAQATAEAFRLLVTGDPQLWAVVGTSLAIALCALALAMPVAVCVAYVLASGDFRGRRLAIGVCHTFLATPTVVVGLVLFLLLSASGPLGALGLLFTPAAVAIGQFIIALPILIAFSLNAIEPRLQLVRETALTLGASRAGAMRTVFAENATGLCAALLTGFGRIISEVGCALLVGGNIAGYTRTIPTAIALDTGRGLFAQGIALGIVLLALAGTTSLLMATLQRRTA